MPKTTGARYFAEVMQGYGITEFVRTEIAKFAKLVKETGTKVD